MVRMEKNRNKRIHWGVVMLDITILISAIFVSVWQDNTKYLWLIVLILITGSTTISDLENE